jgi:hypothetical protein
MGIGISQPYLTRCLRGVRPSAPGVLLPDQSALDATRAAQAHECGNVLIRIVGNGCIVDLRQLVVSY